MIRWCRPVHYPPGSDAEQGCPILYDALAVRRDSIPDPDPAGMRLPP